MDSKCRLLSLTVLLAVGPLGCMAWGIASEQPKWWQNTVIYEIYPQSFYDTNNDGFGDIKGITEKAHYLKELGVGAVWINPFYKSPLKDNGYDISDFRKIDERFGTMDDFDDMIHALKWENGIELIMDFVPNHTSDQHEWFQKSVKREGPYTDYYVWKDPKEWKDGKPVPPNNWESIFAPGQPSSAWQWNEERQQFYFHAFLVEQPDLNFRNPEVIQDLKDVMKFWMDKGVNGFRMDAVPHLVEDGEWRDEYGNHDRTQNLPETYRVIQDFREFLDEYGEDNSVDIFLTTEGYAGPEETIRYYGPEHKPGAHFPFNFLLLTDFNSETTAHSLKNTIQSYLDRLLASHQFPNWVSGNHDWPRIPSRMGASSATDILNILNLLLPGTSTVYMGDELGMDSYWNLDKNHCPPGVGDDYRTPGRTPFHWSTEKNAGFTTSNKPWVPVNPEFYRTNYVTENRSMPRGQVSHLQNFKKLLSLKKQHAFTNGPYEAHALDDNVFVFIRQDPTYMYVSVLNLGKSFSAPINLKSAIPSLKAATNHEVEVKSVNLAEDCATRVACFKKFMGGNWSMPPKSGAVLSFQKPLSLSQNDARTMDGPSLSMSDLNSIFSVPSQQRTFKKVMSSEQLGNLVKGPFNSYKINDEITAFARSDLGLVYVTVLNTDENYSETFDLKAKIPELEGTVNHGVEAKSNNLNGECFSNYECFENFMGGKWNMPPQSGAILSFTKLNSQEGSSTSSVVWSDLRQIFRTSDKLELFKELMSAKKKGNFAEGPFKSYRLSDDGFALVRVDSNNVYVAVLNLSSRYSELLGLKGMVPELEGASNNSVELQTEAMKRHCFSSSRCFSNFLNGDFNMPPNSGVILSFTKRCGKTNNNIKVAKSSFKFGRGFGDDDD